MSNNGGTRSVVSNRNVTDGCKGRRVARARFGICPESVRGHHRDRLSTTELEALEGRVCPERSRIRVSTARHFHHSGLA